MVAIIYKYKDDLVLETHQLKTGEKVRRILPGFEKVNSFSYSPDGKKLSMSAVKRNKGQSDIFVFSINTSGIEQLTNDIWDDNNPVFVVNNKQIAFESDRPGDTIKVSEDANYSAKIRRNNDIFMAAYPFTNKVLVRLSNTPDENETHPQAYGKLIAFVSDKNGIHNRYIAEYDSAIS